MELSLEYEEVRKSLRESEERERDDEGRDDDEEEGKGRAGEGRGDRSEGPGCWKKESSAEEDQDMVCLASRCKQRRSEMKSADSLEGYLEGDDL